MTKGKTPGGRVNPPTKQQVALPEIAKLEKLPEAGRFGRSKT